MADYITLLHYTDKKLKKVDISFFGINSYTFNDIKTSGVKRSYFYLQGSKVENRFLTCQYCYKIKINKSLLYDLITDKKGYKSLLVSKFYGDIDLLLKYIKKQGYKGIIYDSGGLNIVNLFYTIKII